MVSEHSGAQQPELEIPGWAWGAIGTVIGFGLVFWLAFGIMADLTTTGFAPSPNNDPSSPIVADGSRTVATEFAFSAVAEQSTGVVELFLVNEGATFHNLEIAGPDGEPIVGFLLEAEPGVTVSGAIELEAGRYTLFCSVPGHREAGMETALEVTG